MSVISIPEQLRKEGFRFIKLKFNNKIPEEKNWQVDVNYSYDDEAFLNHNGNYGVATGFNNLIVLDFDDVDTWEEIKDLLPKTFAVKTATKGMPHLYYYCKDTTSFVIKNKAGKQVIDVQGKGKQVVGAGSIINTKKYEINWNEEIVELPIEILNKIRKFYGKPKIVNVFQRELVEGGRNNSFYISASNMRDLGTDRETCLNIMLSTNDKNKNKLPEGEVKRIVNNVYNYKKSDGENTDINAPLLFLLAKGKKREATEQIVQEILSKKHIYTIRKDTNAEMWIYEQGIYVPHAKTYIKQFAREKLNEFYTSHLLNEIIAKVEVETFIDEKVFFADDNKEWIAVKNGLLNLKTRELKDFTPELVFFNKLPVEFIPGVDCPLIKKFINEIIEHEEDINIIQELFGYVLYKDYQIEKSFMFLGKGRNGKGQLLELLQRFVGVENTSSVSLQRLCDENSFNIAELHTKLINEGGDIDGGFIETTGMFKQLSGNDMVSAKRKFMSDLHFKNYAKMIFSSNTLPTPKDTSQGFWDRWILLKFPFRFEHEELFLGKSEDELRFFKPRINNVVESFSTDVEMQGLLNWALDGLDRLLAQSHFTFSGATQNVRKRWTQEANSFAYFCELYLEKDFEGMISKEELRGVYSMFCKKNGLDPLSDKFISGFLSREFGVSGGRFRKLDVDIYMWKGVRFNPDFALVDENGFSLFQKVLLFEVD